MDDFLSEREPDKALLPLSSGPSQIELAAQVATRIVQQHVLSDNIESKSRETLRRQAADIAVFEAYLAKAGALVSAMASDL